MSLEMRLGLQKHVLDVFRQTDSLTHHVSVMSLCPVVSPSKVFAPSFVRRKYIPRHFFPSKKLIPLDFFYPSLAPSYCSESLQQYLVDEFNNKQLKYGVRT